MSGFVYESGVQRRISRLPADLIAARELFLDLAWKDLRVRFRYAVLGFLWAILQPLALMIVLTIVFSFLLGARLGVVGEGVEYDLAVMILCGLIFWQFLASALASGTRSIVDNQNLVKKVAFAREVLPLASLMYPLVNLLIGFVVLLIVHVARGGELSPALVWLLPVFVIQFILAAGLVLLFSGGHVHYHDVGYIVDVVVLFGFYASPVFYPIETVTQNASVPPLLELLYLMNPMAELLTAYRQILLEGRFPDAWLLAWPAVVAVLALVAGAALFRRLSPTLSDHL